LRRNDIFDFEDGQGKTAIQGTIVLAIVDLLLLIEKAHEKQKDTYPITLKTFF
jgi:hypothetical protein